MREAGRPPSRMITWSWALPSAGVPVPAVLSVALSLITSLKERLLPIRGLDHVAITCADIEATLDFYKRVLGAETHFEDLWREGKIPVVLMQVGESRLSVHSAAAPAKPHAHVPMPGSEDMCFRWDGPIEEAANLLDERGVEIILGPVARPAADGQAGQSVYFRDPDQNLVELLSTD